LGRLRRSKIDNFLSMFVPLAPIWPELDTVPSSLLFRQGHKSNGIVQRNAFLLR
jgi:hypothetical protein